MRHNIIVFALWFGQSGIAATILFLTMQAALLFLQIINKATHCITTWAHLL
jgi:hypothetical protein